jgi:hypothetical protein
MGVIAGPDRFLGTRVMVPETVEFRGDTLSGPHSIEENAANVNSSTNPDREVDTQTNQFSTSVPFIRLGTSPILVR